MGVGSLWRERVADVDADAGPTRWTCVGWIIESRRREEPGRGQEAGAGQKGASPWHWTVWKGEVES